MRQRERVGRVAVVGDLGFQVTSSCNLLRPSGPAQAQYCIYLFKLECSCACLALWLGGSGSKFMIDSSGLAVIWWPMIRHSFSTKPCSKPEGASQKESSYLGKKVALCSKSLRFCIVVHLQNLPDLQKASLSAAGTHGRRVGERSTILCFCQYNSGVILPFIQRVLGL